LAKNRKGFISSFHLTPYNYGAHVWYWETRNAGLLSGMIIGSAVSTQYQRVTDGQTDRLVVANMCISFAVLAGARKTKY